MSVRGRAEARLNVARLDAGVFAGYYVEDVEALLRELDTAETVRDACQTAGTSVVNFRRKVVSMLRAIGYHGMAEDVERLRVADEVMS